jgi:uncharacterized protein (TIGR03086 family)
VSYPVARAPVQRWDDDGMDELVERHQRACAGFARIAHSVPAPSWGAPTPCTEWTARDLVEHVIGFHEFLLLRPLGVRVQRPRDDPPGRFDATSAALFRALAPDDALDQATELPGGGESTPRTMLAQLTTDVLVHTWDLACAARISPDLDEDLCERAYRAVQATGVGRDAGMVGPEVVVSASAAIGDRLVAFYGRDPNWAP